MAKNMQKKAVFNWSGGKDSALALYKVLARDEYEVISLLTTINTDSKRSSMHGIPAALLQAQAESIGIPIHLIETSPDSGMENYEQAMKVAVEHFTALGVTHFIFGDIFLADVKAYREKQLQEYGITVVEPLWLRTTEQIMEEFLASGLQTIIVTVTADVLEKEFIQRKIDRDFFKTLT